MLRPLDDGHIRTPAQDPMDLSTMDARLKRANYYTTLDIFVADFRRIVDNCRVYNLPDTVYNKLAAKLEAAFDCYLASHVISDAVPP
jgi:histone acetyltransferase